MHEKTLLYSALGATAIAAVIGVYKARGGGGESTTEIIQPIPLTNDGQQKAIVGTEVPVRLTASDGTGLKLIALKAEAAVDDPLALTELHLTFENPENRVLEGTFRITLPQGASLSRFAMKVGGAWQEGEVVEKQAARQAYEDFLHRKQDPALMEQGAGNEFSARVFPIPARGTKEIIVTYAEAIEVGAPYVLPLRGLPQLGSLDVDVHVAGSLAAAAGGKTSAAYAAHQKAFTPAADFVVEGKQVPRSPGLRNGELAIARVVPFASSRPEPVESAVVLVDTSASRGLGIADQAKLVRDVIAKLPEGSPVVVACFDQEVEPIFEGKAGAFGQKDVDAIVTRGALGASDFEGAIAWAGEASKKAKAKRVIFVSDGVATAGETDGQKLRSKVEALRGTGVTRMDAIATGGIRDDGFLRTIVRGVLDRDGVVLDAKLGPDALARRLGEATSSGVPVKVEGARWSWPEKLDGLQSGDEVLVYAELEGSGPVRIDIGGQQFKPDLRNVDRPLVERAWAQAKIQSLIEDPKEGAAATKQQIVALSTRHRVLSPHTALLVLETDADYRRFNIDRNAKVDILTIENGRVAITTSGRSWEEEARKDTSAKKGEGRPTADRAAAPAAPAASAAPARDEAPSDPAAAPGTLAEGSAQGGLGLRGGGAGGGGSGRAEGLGGLGGGTNGPTGHAAAPAAEPAPAPPPSPRPTARPTEDSDSYGGDQGAPSRSRAANDDNRREAPAHRAPPPRPLAPPHAIATATAPPPPSGDPDVAVRPGALTIDHGIAADEVQRVIRGAVPSIRACYATEHARNATLSGRLNVRFVVAPEGNTKSATLDGASGGAAFQRCVVSTMTALHFTAPVSSDAVFTQAFDLVGGGGGNAPGDAPKSLPYEGRFKVVMEALSRGDKDSALGEANRWHVDQPGDVLSLVALGEVYEARNEERSAARAYGSILELFSFRADSRRFAGERLERLHDARALALAVDTYAKAAEQRPDHPASHRLYAYALLKKGDHEKAFEAMKKGASRSYPTGRFRGVDRILKEDLGLIAAAWIHAQPQRGGEIRQKLKEAGGTEESGPSLRFVLNWETDANDVDFHIHDGKGGHAYYAHAELPSGGSLYADVTTGYGPECFTIRGPRAARAYPYTLQAHYFSRGPMGYGMGKLEVLEHDGNGGLMFEERPFVVMLDHAFVDMGSVASRK